MATGFTLLLAACLLLVLAVAAAAVLGWADRAFHVEVSPQLEAILSALPGANCGGCGFVGCAEYAEAAAAGTASLTLCGPGGASCAQALAQITGSSITPTFPYRAVVHCAATGRQRLPAVKPPYRGELTCAAANLVAGFQGCTYGCLGLGDCASACRYDAIHVVDGLAVVDYANCTGCKACAKACPRNIISMVPFKSDRMLVVACCNSDNAPAVRAVCPIGCISCSTCSKKSSLMHMEGNLPVIDYDAYRDESDFVEALAKCPRESLIFVGEPHPADLVKVAGEELPARIEADFQTTVDDTQWWG
ncbi:MAG: electron transporter RnfB [Planctomycetes bacterium]|nr:electron transporter RnfB [Planctomycetota bacterium]